MVYGVGINDLPGWRKDKDPKKEWLYKEWQNMFMRCYSKKYLEKRPTYIGCTVCERWLTFSNFVEDAPLLPGWEVVIECNFKGINLDKDARIPNNKIYSPEACSWMTCFDNTKERNTRHGNPRPDKPVIAINPNGEIFEYKSIREVARRTGVSNTTVKQACSMAYGSHTLKKGRFKGWTFKFKNE